jgi:hypothetical protein
MLIKVSGFLFFNMMLLTTIYANQEAMGGVSFFLTSKGYISSIQSDFT